jgi:CheY-like chemotaxis protein
VSNGIENHATSGEARLEAPRPGTDAPRVLVVDDDPTVGAAIKRCLPGFLVTYAQSATGALGRVLAGGRFQAVVCDVFMPGMSGLKFHAELLRQAPDLARRLVFVSGAVSAEIDDYVRRQHLRWVAKPFTGVELRVAVAAATEPVHPAD